MWEGGFGSPSFLQAFTGIQMTTGTKIIHAALQRIGGHSPLSPANPESIQTSLDTLNSFVAELVDDNVDMGCVPLTEPGGDLSEPLGARNAIIDNLAIELQPMFPGTLVSPELKANASKGMSKIRTQWEKVVIPKRIVRDSLPKGEGNKPKHGNSYYGNTFFEEGDTLG